MAKLAPPNHSPVQVTKQTDQQITSVLRSMLKETFSDGDKYMSVGQGIARRLVNIALYAQSDGDALRAIKEINDRIEGKTTVVKRDEKKQLPRILIALDDEEISTINNRLKNGKESDLEEPEEEGFIIETDDGQEFILWPFLWD